MRDQINILFMASEADPYIKIGGLADVAGSLPLALRSLSAEVVGGLELDVRIVIPLHRAVNLDAATMRPFMEYHIPSSDGITPIKVYQTNLQGMPVYLIHSELFSQSERVYDIDPRTDRDKYAHFSLAVLGLIKSIAWKVDILHANDWHTSLALYALRMKQEYADLFHVRTAITLHNLPYMGGEASDVLKEYGIPPINNDDLPEWARTFLLPLGLWAADAIIPVSPTYGREILTPEFGCGLEKFLRSKAGSITGILNGIDMKANDPSTDRTIPGRFSEEKLEGRYINKAALQKTFQLTQDARIPVIGMVGRIDQQKGVDLAFEALRQSMTKQWQFVLLGSGDPTLEALARNLEEEFPDRVSVALRYDADLGRLIYAGADIFLMPSRYEPCGLAQMFAMRYGCVPVVHATGGLKDTVEEGRNGFTFQMAEAEDLAEAMGRALSVFANPIKWQRYQRAGMGEDFSWTRSARSYAMIYRSLLAV